MSLKSLFQNSNANFTKTLLECGELAYPNLLFVKNSLAGKEQCRKLNLPIDVGDECLIFHLAKLDEEANINSTSPYSLELNHCIRMRANNFWMPNTYADMKVERYFIDLLS